MWLTEPSSHSRIQEISSPSWSKACQRACIQFSSVQFSHSVMSDSVQPHEPKHARLPCRSPTPGVYSNPCPSSWWCHPTISSSAIPFSSCLQSFPALGSFPMSQFFTSGGLAIKLKRAWYSEEKKLVGDSSLLWSVSQAFQMPFSMQRKRIFLSKTDSHPFVLFPHVVFSHP